MIQHLNQSPNRREINIIKPLVKKPSISYFTSSNQLKEGSNIQLNMKPIQTSFINNSLYSSLIMQSPTINSGVQMYQIVISKLFKFLKKKLSINLYNEVKAFFKGELIKTSSFTRNESLSSIFDMQCYSSRDEVKNEKKLKLSYDLSNSKAKSIKIDMSHAKKSGKELHSLYSIIKGNHKMITKNIKPSKTQSNSKSKSKSKSTSRECSSTHTHHQIFSNQKNKKVVKVKQSLINKSQPLLNGKLFSKLNIRVCSKPLCPLSKLPNVNSIVIKTTNNLFHHNYNKIQSSSHSKSVTPIANHNTKTHKSKNTSSLIFHNKPLTTMGTAATIQTQINQNKTLNIDTRKNTYVDHDNNPPNTYSNRNQNIQGIETDCIESTSNATKTGNAKNEELMKAIKSTLDDNLKVMFNFSYENFLSKESENESKNNSLQEVNSNDQIDFHYHTTTNRKR